MIITTTEGVAGREVIENLGIVRGNTVRAKHVGKDILAGFKNIIGGEIRGYTEMFTESREQAMERMIAEAEEMGADAVINVRFVTSMVATTASEFLAYGTAVKLK